MPAIGRNSLTEYTLSNWDGTSITIRIIKQTDENGELLPSNVTLVSPGTPADESPWGNWWDSTAEFSINGKSYRAVRSDDSASLYSFLMDCVGKLVITIERSSNVTIYQSRNNLQEQQGTSDPNSFYSYCDW